MENTHGGDARATARMLGLNNVPELRMDFSVNVNPLGPPPCLSAVLAAASNRIDRYPQAWAEDAAESLAQAHGVDAGQVIVGNGSTEIFSLVLNAFKPRRAAWVIPAYSGYEDACRAAGITAAPVSGPCPENNFRIDLERIRTNDADIIFLASPNNPTGVTLQGSEVIALAKRNPNCRIILDEAFVDFLPDAEIRTLISNNLPSNLIVVKSLTKFFAVPGLRVGMACSSLETISRLQKVRSPWSVNILAQAACAVFYRDREYVELSRRVVRELREQFSSALSRISGLTVFPSEANYILVRLPRKWPAVRLQAELLRRGILIRSCGNFAGLGESYCRLAVRPREESEELVSSIESLFHKSQIHRNPRADGAALLQKQSAARWDSAPYQARATSIMVVGTASSAGKSIVGAALCRYFARRGYRVAPFKAQNMALNSFVTAEGGEMGRAQVTQAKAARVEPHTDMNPILLKPMGDSHSQVIVNGAPAGNMTAGEYYAARNSMREAALAAYDRLSSRYDLLIIEGAGSPAEINLRKDDFVNMAMAEYASARTILVADIDRGGVFASILGTVSLLPLSQRRLISGVIINKFRGDISLLKSGILEIESLTGIRVLGVIPYLRDLYLDEEDSLGLENRGPVGPSVLNITVIRLPRISNYTDFMALETVPGIGVRYVSSSGDFVNSDLIIIPGSKNTRADLQFIHETGLAGSVKQAVKNGIPVFGICGGYQMLGRVVRDPDGVEGSQGETQGLDLLPIETVLEPRKELSQVSGETSAALPFAESGTAFKGYEIHAGKTTPVDPERAPLIIRQRHGVTCRELSGTCSDDGLVFGCYIHGLFDEQGMGKQLVEWLCHRKGIDPCRVNTDGKADMEACLDRLTDVFEEHVKMDIVEGWVRVGR